MRTDAWELFAETVALYPSIFMVPDDKPVDSTPSLTALCTHIGTTWPWNRAVYSHLDGGHLRIEFRALPAGPTVIDMLANAALMIGWALALADSIEERIAQLPFQLAEYNFYRAAQHGLTAQVIWPSLQQSQPETVEINTVIKHLLPEARRGLESIGVDSIEIDRLLKVIEHRLETGQTGSCWQLQQTQYYRSQGTVFEAHQQMLRDYVENLMLGNPVSSWPLHSVE